MRLMRLSPVVAVTFASLLAPAARAAQSSPDQENLVATSFSASAVFCSPMGQTFLPARNALDWVELCFANMDPAMPLPAMVRVNVREGDMSGPLVGTSHDETLSFGFAGVVHFEFLSKVHLKSETPYVIEIVANPAGGNAAAVGGWENSYAKGCAVMQGVPMPPTDNSDLWFREGVYPRSRSRGQGQ